MAGVDLSAQFEQIPGRAKVAPDQVRAADQRGVDAATDEAESALRGAMYSRTRVALRSH